MLSQDQIEYIDSSFSVYDHDWRFYSEFLGEPFLCSDLLTYFDGTFLYCCAFSLSSFREKISSGTLRSSLSEFPYINTVKGIRIWGNYEDPKGNLELANNIYKVVGGYESDASEIVLDVTNFDYSELTKARLARNAARNKNITTEITRPSRLSFEHIALMENFFATHDVSTMHTAYYLSVPCIIKNENIFLVEGRVEESLKGFAVMSRTNKETASLLICFYDNIGAPRVADGIMAHIISWAQENKLKKIHFGYSASKSLLAFKKKWGAAIEGPTYRGNQYAIDDHYAKLLTSKTYLWRDRIFQLSL